MSKLIMYAEDGSVKEFTLDRERVTLGRKAHNDIYLDGLAVSGDHAVIITLAGDSFMEDLNSTNGTWVNQKAIQKCVLHDGDEIKIAGYRFSFVKDDSTNDDTVAVSRVDGKIGLAAHRTPLDEATVMPAAPTELRPMPSPARLVPAGPAVAGEPDVGVGAVGVIRILAGPGSGQSLKLTRPLTSLGKPGIQVAGITLRNGRYYLGLVEGDELPLVNGKPIVTMPYPLKHKDVVDVAGVQLEFTLI